MCFEQVLGQVLRQVLGLMIRMSSGEQRQLGLGIHRNLGQQQLGQVQVSHSCLERQQ